MMKRMKTARLVLAVAGVLMTGGLACAQGPGRPDMGPGMGMHCPPMERAFGFAFGQFWNNPNLVKQLDLSGVQRKAMDGILQDHRMKLIDLRANLEKAEVEMGPMMKADAPDQKAIEAQIDRVVAARADLEKANALFLLDIRMQLLPQQWKQLRALRMNRMQHWQRMQHGQDRGGWGQDGQRPGMGGPGMGGPRMGGPRMSGPGMGGPGMGGQGSPGNQPPADAPQQAPAPPANSGGAQ